MLIGFDCAASSAKETHSGDAFVNFDERARTWALGTSMVEESMALSGGNFSLTKLQNRLDGRDLVTSAKPSEEFRVTVDGTVYTGVSGRWVLKSSEATVLPQGEIRLVVQLDNELLQVEKTYVVYPHTSIIRQWMRFQNLSPHAIKVSDPYFLSDRIQVDQDKKPALDYMTGGGYFTGSQILKHVPLTATYARTFDSTDKPERAEVGGSSYGDSMPWGAGAYLQWFCIDDAGSQEGLFVGFDYYGRWAADIGNYFGGSGYVGVRVAGYQKELARENSWSRPWPLSEFSPGIWTVWGTSSKTGNINISGITPTTPTSPRFDTRQKCSGKARRAMSIGEEALRTIGIIEWP